jgi:hypothetical protein
MFTLEDVLDGKSTYWLLKANSTIERIGSKVEVKKLSLEQLQKFVGGDVQVVKTKDKRNMYIAEEGRLLTMLPNVNATQLDEYDRVVVGNVVVVPSMRKY